MLVDGSLMCPLTPVPLVDATQGAEDKAIRVRSPELREAIAGRGPFHLKLKQGADHRGTIRLQCPGHGDSRSVNCPRRNRLVPRQAGTPGAPRTVIDLGNTRKRASDPAARPTVILPEEEWTDPPPKKELPEVCGEHAIRVPADADGNLHVAKYRQDVHYLSPVWDATHKPIRSHNEGINGRFKSGELDIGNPKIRLARGQVAHTLLVAIMITIGNLAILETWLYERTGVHLTEADYEAVSAPGPLDLLPAAAVGGERSPSAGER
ncbi:hypothetical protein [Streptomyces hoynatensis]|uniref:Transposase DDE domain-containing protein n=1 Tax=Streptomyces hoynatensis TaxID=1141874 RepID=A0A3A9Z0Z9_9ACTN|nr:hypothetical protein [Streptomyces hoynatensis]RKN41624.1 hypothetical protein D7294_14095 [Streptomyces hoynatensis]